MHKLRRSREKKVMDVIKSMKRVVGMMIVLFIIISVLEQVLDVDASRRRPRHWYHTAGKKKLHAPPTNKGHLENFPLPPTAEYDIGRYVECVRENKCLEKESFEEKTACCDECKKKHAKKMHAPPANNEGRHGNPLPPPPKYDNWTLFGMRARK